MGARDQTIVEKAKMPESESPAVSIDELHRQLEKRDSRLLSMETSLKDVQNSIQIWSTIIQEGLADVSVQVKVASLDRRFRSMQQTQPGSETVDDSKISERLSEVEQKMEAVQINALEAPQFVARIATAEQKLQELHKKIQELLVDFVPEAKDSPDMPSKYPDMRNAEKNSHNCTVQGKSLSMVVPAISASRQSMRSAVISTVHDPPISPKSTIPAYPPPSTAQLLHLHRDRVQSLSARQSISPQSVIRQQSCVANDLPTMRVRRPSTGDLNAQVAALTTPRPQHRNMTESNSRHSFGVQRPTLVPPYLCQASRQAASCSGSPQPTSARWVRTEGVTFSYSPPAS